MAKQSKVPYRKGKTQRAAEIGRKARRPSVPSDIPFVDKSSMKSKLESARSYVKGRLAEIRYKVRHESPATPRKRWRDCGGGHKKGCCDVLLDAILNKGTFDKNKLHKPKVPTQQKLSCLAQVLERRDSVAPQLFHLLDRFLAKKQPGNEFEKKVFSDLKSFSKKEIDALRLGLNAFNKISPHTRTDLFMPEFLDWAIDQPVDPDVLLWETLDEGLTLSGRGFNLDTMCQPGKVRPWLKEDPHYVEGPLIGALIIVPKPWINAVNGLRTATHRQPLDYYDEEEYQQNCKWNINTATGEPEPECKYALDPSCEVSAHQSNGQCLRVPDTRIGNTVTLTGFNFFSNNCKVTLTKLEGDTLTTSYILDGYACGDQKTPVKDNTGVVIADHRVKDTLTFQIDEWTPDGLYKFPAGIYQIVVTVPNDINFTNPDGSQPNEFASNPAFIKILPAENVKYRIWSEQAFCHHATDGEWGSDEVYVKAFPVILDPKQGGAQELPSSSVRWDGAESGQGPQQWDWNIFGEEGNPQSFSGALAIGIIGWEVDSEDALKEQITAYDAAFTKFWEIVYKFVAGIGGTAVFASIIAWLLKSAGWIGLIVVVIAVVIVLVIGLIWAGWAPADLIIADVIVLSEEDIYYLTHPTSPLPSPLPPQSPFSNIQDIKVRVTPDWKYDYLYSEQRDYLCGSEESEYRIKFNYLREVH